MPDEYLEAILKFAAQAPSGYNLQPWRFIVVRDKANRERLQKAAYNQEKIRNSSCSAWRMRSSRAASG